MPAKRTVVHRLQFVRERLVENTQWDLAQVYAGTDKFDISGGVDRIALFEAVVQHLDDVIGDLESPFAHMYGWECFGVTERPDAHIVRRIGTWEGHPKPPPKKDLDRWHPSEIHNGVAAVDVSFHGDDPDHAFVHVWGVDPVAVERMWQSVAERVEASPLTWS